MKKSKLLTIILFANSLLVVASLITFAILQVNTRPNLPTPTSINIYNHSTASYQTIKNNDAEFEQIMNIYNSMFEKTDLQQLLDNEILTNNLLEDCSGETWNDYKKNDGVFVELCFESSKKFVIYRENNSRQVFVKSLIFNISNKNKTQDIDIYYTTDKSSTSEPIYPLKAQANTHDLYQYIASLKENK